MLCFVAPYFWPDTWLLRVTAVLSVLFTLAAKGANILVPITLRMSVDALSSLYKSGATQSAGDAQAAGVRTAVLGVVLYGILKFCVNAFGEIRSYCWQHVSLHVTRDFSVSTFKHLHDLPMSYHLTRKTGEVLRVMDRGVSSLSTLMQLFMFTIGPTLLELALVCGIFLRLKTARIAIIVFMSAILYVVFSVVMTQWRVKFRRELNDKDNEVNTAATDSLLNFETVKYFVNEQFEVSRYNALLTAFQDASLRTQLSLSALNVGQALIVNVATVISMLCAAHAAVNELISVGEFVMVNQYILQLYQPLLWLGSAYRTINRAFTDLESMIQLREIRNSVADVPNAPCFRLAAGEIQFDNVSFSYDAKTSSSSHNNAQDAALQESSDANGAQRVDIARRDGGHGSGSLCGLSFTVPAGKMLAVVGATGAGKSTVLRLLLRFYDPTGGRVIVDGQDISMVQQRSYRQNLGVVAQDSILFNASLRYNVQYARPDANDDDILAALEVAQLGDLLERLGPSGLDTMVGERGMRLSGGEKQRVGVARMVMMRPGIILLDEATSALDTRTERKVQAALQEVCRGRTAVVIAHRLSTIVDADEILVLRDGQAAERGSHAELMQRKGEYYRMWQSQLESESIAATLDYAKV